MNNRPNFVFILADDLGYADLGCYGGRANPSCSPAIDQMATEGLVFTNGYSNAPVCSPTRFALMTGRFQYRLRAGNDEPIASRHRGNAVLGLPPAHPTLPSILRDAGYQTALAGKWHLGFLPHFSPLKSGYSEFFGPMSGGVDYFTHRDSAGAHRTARAHAQALSNDGLGEAFGRVATTAGVAATPPRGTARCSSGEATARRAQRPNRS